MLVDRRKRKAVRTWVRSIQRRGKFFAPVILFALFVLKAWPRAPLERSTSDHVGVWRHLLEPLAERNYRQIDGGPSLPIHQTPTVAVSVIITYYSNVNALFRCIDSVLKNKLPVVREYHMKPLQLIVVNDGAPDTPVLHHRMGQKYTVDWARSHLPASWWSSIDLLLVDKENGGVADARNVGLQLISGIYVILIDGDDAISSDYFSHVQEKLGNRFLEDGDFHVIAPTLQYSNWGVWEMPFFGTTDLRQQNWFYVSVMFHRSLLNPHPGSTWWMPQYFFFGWEDWAFWLQNQHMIQKVLYVETPLFYYTGGSMHKFPEVHYSLCRALLTVSRPDIFSEASVMKAVKYVSDPAEKRGAIVHSHHAWGPYLQLYGGISPQLLLWSALCLHSEGEIESERIAIDKALDLCLSQPQQPPDLCVLIRHLQNGLLT